MGESFINKHFPFVFQHFRFAYVGIFAPHVWIFCITHRLDAAYSGADVGIPLYIALSVFMAVAMLFAWKRRPKNPGRLLDWPVAAVMATATVFLVFPFSFTNSFVVTLAAILAGFGIAWTYLGWAAFYAKLDIKNAIACIFGAMAVGSACKILIDLMPALPATICLVALPFVSVILARQATRKQPSCETEVRIYYTETKTSIPWSILLGVAVYSVILGVVQGMTFTPPSLPLELTTLVHHGGEIIVAVLILWWVFGRRGLLHFSSLWRAILLLTATGLFFLPLLGDFWSNWALVLIAIAQTLVVMLFWVMLADVARHSSTSPYVIFGSGWIAYSFSFAIGEIIGRAAQSHDVGVYLLTIMAYLLTLAAVFALGEHSLSQRRIFSDLDITVPEKSMYGSIDRGCTALGARFGLTAREVEVLQLLCKGRSKSYIAENLFISENTVRSHSKHIYQKLEVHSKQEILDLIANS